MLGEEDVSDQSSVVSRQSQSSVVRHLVVRHALVGLAVILLLIVPRAQEPAPLWETGTFSILGFDPATREVGGAVQSRVFSVGNGVLWADADAGIAATQAIVDVGYGPKALNLLRRGVAPAAIVKKIWNDDP